MVLKKGLNPLANKNTRILILGSFPGESSLLMNKYYANNENKLWTIIFKYFKKRLDKF